MADAADITGVRAEAVAAVTPERVTGVRAQVVANTPARITGVRTQVVSNTPFRMTGIRIQIVVPAAPCPKNNWSFVGIMSMDG